jgi:predicted outer membrane protein
MIDDHTKAGDELRQLAAGKGFSWDEAKVKSGEKTGLPTRTGDETRTEKAAEAAATRTDASGATATGAMADSSQTGLSKDGQKSVDKLSKHSGADFDREYMKLMVKNHDKSVALFERQAGGSGDSELKAWASQTLPTLREHQRLARELSTKVGASAAVDRATDRATGDQVRRP